MTDNLGVRPSLSGTITRRHGNIGRPDETIKVSSDVIGLPGSCSAIESALDDENRIQIDLPCQICGYILRAFAINQACPECGVAVSTSIPTDGLVFSNSRWLVRVARGCLFLPVTLIVAIVCGMGLGLIEDFVLQRAQVVQWPFQLIVGTFQVTIAALFVYAFWILTLPEPSEGQQHIRWSTRRIARVLILSSLILDALTDIVLRLTGFFTWPTMGATGIDILRWTSNLLSTGCGLLGFIALFFYAASIAKRIPNNRLARRTDLVRWGFGCALVLSFIEQLFLAVIASLGLYDWRKFRLFDISSNTLETIMIVLAVSFGVWALILILQYRGQLLKVVRLTSQLTKLS